MTYTKQTWVPSVTQVSAARMNYIEDGIVAVDQKPSAGVQYLGDYNPATTYNDGDYVVGPDGVTYVCVQNGTVGVTPAPWAPVVPIAADEIGYDSITANALVTATTEATSNTIIACAPHTFDGNPVICHFMASAVNQITVAGAKIVFSLWEGATEISRLGSHQVNLTAQGFMPFYNALRFTPTAGSHTYTIKAYAQSTTGTPQIYCGTGGIGDPPCYVRFTKTTPVVGYAPSLPPVVNGQWIKGVGGAAVWSAIAPADIAGYPSDAAKVLKGDGSWDNVLQLRTGFGTDGRLKMQSGQANPAAAMGAQVTLSVTLPVAWPTAQLLFLASAWPGTTWTGVSVLASGQPSGLTGGVISVGNTSQAQNFTVYWVSLGY